MSCCAGTLPATASVAIAEQSELLRLQEITRSAKSLSDGTVLMRLSVPTVHCGACISAIEDRLSSVDGVKSARVNLTLRQLTVTARNAEALPIVVSALDQLGYRSHVAGTDDDSSGLKALLRAVAVAGFAATNIMLLSVSVWNGAEDATRDLFHFVSALIALPAVAYAGQPFFVSALGALRHGRTNMDVPISLGIILATAMSLYESVAGGGHAYFDAATSLLFFLLIGRTLDVMMRGRARQLVAQMSKLMGKGAMRVLPDGELAYVTSDQIIPGMMLRVAAGERLPCDATIQSGQSLVDRSLVTGESQPLPVTQGDNLEAGTLNISCAIDISATKTADASFIGEVLQMLEAAERGRGRYVLLADRMARIYAPAVHALALMTFVGWMVVTGGNWHQSLTVAVAVLIITCPCALGLAVPVAHVVAASRLFKNGILVKDGSALERLSEINHVAFDKTGTLTMAEPQYDDGPILPGPFVGIARSLAQKSRHPAAVALAARLSRTSPVEVEGAEETPGFGIKAVFNGREFRLGRASWVSEISTTTTNESGLAFAGTGSDLHLIITTETPREGAQDVVSTFTRCGIPVEILSGDRSLLVARLAEKLGVSNFSASLTPAGKLERLGALARLGRKVLMVGDGLNDAPALAAAHVSIAPASASDIGRTAADFVFLGDNLNSVITAHDVSCKAAQIVKQNFALAIAYNAFAVPLAMAGYLNPFIAAIAMSTSSLLVIGNSLRLGGIATREIVTINRRSPGLQEVTA